MEQRECEKRIIKVLFLSFAKERKKEAQCEMD